MHRLFRPRKDMKPGDALPGAGQRVSGFPAGALPTVRAGHTSARNTASPGIGTIGRVLVLVGLVFFSGRTASCADRGNEPTPPQPEPAAAWKRFPNGDLQLGVIRLHRDRRALSFPAEINMTEGALEVLIASPVGRLHESLFRTTASPLHLQTMLLLLGLRRGPRLPDAQGRQGDLVDILVEWTDRQRKKHEGPVEEWVTDRRRNGPMARCHWVFTGADIDDRGRFLPEIEGNLVLLFSSGETVLDIPDPESTDDTLFSVDTERARAAGGQDAPVRVWIIPRRREPPR